MPKNPTPAQKRALYARASGKKTEAFGNISPQTAQKWLGESGNTSLKKRRK